MAHTCSGIYFWDPFSPSPPRPPRLSTGTRSSSDWIQWLPSSSYLLDTFLRSAGEQQPQLRIQRTSSFLRLVSSFFIFVHHNSDKFVHGDIIANWSIKTLLLLYRIEEIWRDEYIFMCPIENIFFAYKTNRLRQESVKRILLKVRLKMTRLLFLGVILHADRIESELEFFRRGPSDSRRGLSVSAERGTGSGGQWQIGIGTGRCIDWPICPEKNAAVANAWPPSAEWPVGAL